MSSESRCGSRFGAPFQGRLRAPLQHANRATAEFCQDDAIIGELGYTANFTNLAQSFCANTARLGCCRSSRGWPKGGQLLMDLAMLDQPAWPEQRDEGLPGEAKRARNVTEPSDQFQKLEEKLVRLIEVFKRTQAENRALEEQVQALKAEFKGSGQKIESLEKEVAILRSEREDVRGRVERLLSQMESLTKTDSTA